MTLTADEKLEELPTSWYTIDGTFLGISELRWKGIGEATTDKGHKLYYSGKDDRHEHGVGFLDWAKYP